MKLQIKRAAAYGMWGIVAFDLSGREWLLKRTFKTDSAARGRTLSQVREKLEIDLRYWKPRTESAKKFLKATA